MFDVTSVENKKEAKSRHIVSNHQNAAAQPILPSNLSMQNMWQAESDSDWLKEL